MNFASVALGVEGQIVSKTTNKNDDDDGDDYGDADDDDGDDDDGGGEDDDDDADADDDDDADGDGGDGDGDGDDDDDDDNWTNHHGRLFQHVPKTRCNFKAKSCWRCKFTLVCAQGKVYMCFQVQEFRSPSAVHGAHLDFTHNALPPPDSTNFKDAGQLVIIIIWGRRKTEKIMSERFWNHLWISQSTNHQASVKVCQQLTLLPPLEAAVLSTKLSWCSSQHLAWRHPMPMLGPKASWQADSGWLTKASTNPWQHVALRSGLRLFSITRMRTLFGRWLFGLGLRKRKSKKNKKQ